ncbi:hypothetical protein LCGC14_1669600 [marine sediment metagenome]|uniref:Uncharacterized protein n=1 Tax=marine sediment metagenome TaxID=412755 RepID=A0A0F9HSM5_9ZZZZ
MSSDVHCYCDIYVVVYTLTHNNRPNYKPFYVPKEEDIIKFSVQSIPKPPVRVNNSFIFNSSDILRKLQKYIIQHHGRSVGPSVACKKFMFYYRYSSDLTHLKQSQKDRFLSKLYTHIKLLDRKGCVKISSTKARGKITYYLSLTYEGVRYSKGKLRIFRGIRQDITTFIENLTSSGPKTKKNTILSFILGKIITLLLWMALLLILIPIQEKWYQGEYYTPILLLYSYFIWLKLFLILSSSFYALFLMIPVHFIISVWLVRKKRWSSKVIIIYWGLITILTSCIFITNLVFLFGV